MYVSVSKIKNLESKLYFRNVTTNLSKYKKLIIIIVGAKSKHLRYYNLTTKAFNLLRLSLNDFLIFKSMQFVSENITVQKFYV